MSKGGRSFMEMLEATAASPLESRIIKATDSSVDVPKAKHLEALLLFTHLSDYNQGKIVDGLFARTAETSWVTALKSLIIFHRLMRDGHERFAQYLATSAVGINLETFVDATTPDALSMTGFVRSYATYINQKIVLYRQLGFDICHVKASEKMAQMKSDTVAEIGKNLKDFMLLCRKLLICVSEESPPTAVHTEHSQGHGAFSVQVKIPPAMLFDNLCIKGAVRLLLKDALRIFVCMNECVVKLLETYFSAQKRDAQESLAMYEEFVDICHHLDVFFNKCKSGGLLDGRHIPELTAAPKVLLPAMRDYITNYGAKKRSNEEEDAVSGHLAQVRLTGTELDESNA